MIKMDKMSIKISKPNMIVAPLVCPHCNKELDINSIQLIETFTKEYKLEIYLEVIIKNEIKNFRRLD